MTAVWVPVGLALGAAALFGLSGVIAKRGLAHLDAQTGAMVTIGTTVACYLALAPWLMRAEHWFTLGFWIFVLNGLIHPMLSMYCALEATTRTGPTVAATFSATAPLFAALTAVAFLGEEVNGPIAGGTLATVLGVALLTWSGGGVPRLVRAALLFATAAAVIRGLNHTIGKLGLELLPSVYMAGLASFSVSFLGQVVIYHVRTGGAPRRLARAGFGWFALGGAVIGAAIACMYGALASGPVVVVSPIVAAYPVFTLLAALAVGQESLTRRLAGGVALVVLGVALISAGSAP